MHKGTFSKIHHMLGHKANLSKFKKVKITSRICPNHNTMRLDINYKRKKKKKTVKQVEAKLYATKQLVDHRRNKTENQAILGDK